MKAVPLSANFAFDSSYNNDPIQFDVSGLTNMIDTKNIARPVLTFEGLIGHGKIANVVPETSTAAAPIVGKKPFLVDPTGVRLPQPVATGSGVEIHHGVT